MRAAEILVSLEKGLAERKAIRQVGLHRQIGFRSGVELGGVLDEPRLVPGVEVERNVVEGFADPIGETPDRLRAVLGEQPNLGPRIDGATDPDQNTRTKALALFEVESHRQNLDAQWASLGLRLEHDACGAGLHRHEVGLAVAHPFGEERDDAAPGEHLVAAGEGFDVA